MLNILFKEIKKIDYLLGLYCVNVTYRFFSTGSESEHSLAKSFSYRFYYSSEKSLISKQLIFNYYLHTSHSLYNILIFSALFILFDLCFQCGIRFVITMDDYTFIKKIKKWNSKQ